MNHLLQQWGALTVFFENEVNAGKKKTLVSTSMPKSAACPVQKTKATPFTSLPATVPSKLFCSNLPKLPTSSTGPGKRSNVSPHSKPEVKTPAHIAAQFDLIFKENKKTKSERTKKEIKGNLTKPEKILDPMSKVYALFQQRAIPIFDIGKKMLQKEEPCILILLPTLELQLQKKKKVAFIL